MKRLILGVFASLPALVGAQEEGPTDRTAEIPAPPSAAAESYAGKVVVIEIGEHDLLDLRKFNQWGTILDRAGSDKARAVVIRVNAPGGDAMQTLDLMEKISTLSVPSFALVDRTAVGAGALVAVSAKTIYLAPDAMIGGAGIVSGEDGEGKEIEQKLQSLMHAKLRVVLARQGHNLELVQSMMMPTGEEKSFGSVLLPKGTLLTLTAAEATSELEGKALLAKGIAKDVAELLAKEGLDGVEVVNPNAKAEPKSGVTPPSERRGVTRSKEEQAKPSRLKDEESFEGKIVVLSVGEEDLANKQSFKFWRRMLRRAEDENAAAVVFDLDTPGGFAFETRDLMTELTRLKVPSYAFVNPNALSAGALVSVATDGIYVNPDATIGAAGLVNSAGEIEEMMRKKLHSVFEAHLRAIAEKKGYDPELIRAMMIPDEKNDRVFGEVVVKKGTLLSLTAREATSLRHGEPLLAKAIVNSVEEIAALEGLAGVPIVRAEPQPFERFAWWVSKWSFLLILIGMGAAYAEMKTPGFGVGGAISLAAFGIFFFGNYVAGNLAGYEMFALFALGVVLILVEIFLIPGTGLAGIVGAGCIVAALLFGMVDKIEWGDWRVGEFSGNLLDLLRGPVLSLGAGLLGGTILIAILMRYLPNVPFFRFLVVEQASASGASLPDGAGAGHEERVGWTGEAVTDLRPAGKAKFGDEAIDVVADDGAFVPKAAKVRIVAEDGMRVVVAQIEPV